MTHDKQLVAECYRLIGLVRQLRRLAATDGSGYASGVVRDLIEAANQLERRLQR